ncbi:(Fe-S)-binding protein [Natrinema salsiterrestre]|uniref:Heterodisulfide reductase-related iron-sulfur binding cluster n=1 Tax=Natrinema salsiterrestre TaxID=2950540 RepID=A0A9Q4Q1K5_9EURY|nr:heterodisulfide reductase-related iron-sulfur binding cluster [Natrinema salsiterrestre]MDF9747359.1 heterodisulfide reductase-related iron-sulfur binding cluster [Natrinema salsiterrestre]
MNGLAQSDVARETYWGITSVEYAVFYLLAFTAIAIFVYGVYQRFARYADGDDDSFARLDDLPDRIVSSAKIVLSNEKQFNRDLYGGLMHSFILWGFLTLFIATSILAFDMYGVQKLFQMESFWEGDFYLAYQFMVDAMGLLFVVGIGMAMYRRYWVRNHRLWGRHTSNEDDVFIWTLFALGVGGFLLEGLRVYSAGIPDHEIVSFVAYGMALGFDAMGLSTLGPEQAGFNTAGLNVENLHWLAWWSHSLIAFFFIAWIPYAKPFHMISSFANVVTRDEKAGQRLPNVPSDLDATNAESIDDFTWKEILDQDACTKCGRCSSVCPAKASDRPLDPRDVILDLKSYREDLDAGGEEQPIVADGGTSVINSETMESCMACMACMDACPVEIEHLKSFTRLNRQLTDQGDVDSSMQDVFQNVMQNGNTFGDSPRNRGDWADELEFDVTDAREEEVDYLWYVGDFPSYDERNKQVARSLATILKEADVSFGILFDDEKFDGNDIRRVGEELLYVELAGHHVETWEDCEFDKIVCTDPHSYNTFKNEYPEVNFDEFADDPMMPFDYEEQWNEDGEIDVLHWTQAVEELVSDGNLDLNGTELDYTVTYHDPCHLGRYNDEYEAPRELIKATGCELDEMPRNRSNSFCCGGGGGGLWMDFEEEPKPSEERIREALEDTDAGSGVEKFVVACPMCMTMYEDGRKTGGYEDEIEIVDVAELIVEAIGKADEAKVEVAAD